MNGALTVLVTGAGGTYGLATIRSLRLASISVRLVGADVDWTAPGLFEVDAPGIIPRVVAPDFNDSLADLCHREGVKAVFVTSGSEIMHIATHRDRLEMQTGALMVVNSKSIIDLTSDKLATAQALFEWGFAAPRTADATSTNAVEVLVREVGFPLIAKPRFGRGSQGLRMVRNHEALAIARQEREPYVLQEYIGDVDHEYTVGVIGNEEGLIFGSVVLRRWLKAGQTVACESVDHPAITAYAEAIASKIRPRGYLNVQLRMREGAPCAFEINGRVSSSTGFRALAGFNEPELIIKTHLLGEHPPRPTIRKARMVRSAVEHIIDDARWEMLAPA